MTGKAFVSREQAYRECLALMDYNELPEQFPNYERYCIYLLETDDRFNNLSHKYHVAPIDDTILMMLFGQGYHRLHSDMVIDVQELAQGSDKFTLADLNELNIIIARQLEKQKRQFNTGIGIIVDFSQRSYDEIIRQKEKQKPEQDPVVTRMMDSMNSPLVSPNKPGFDVPKALDMIEAMLLNKCTKPYAADDAVQAGCIDRGWLVLSGNQVSVDDKVFILFPYLQKYKKA
jgi:hypothetical protein